MENNELKLGDKKDFGQDLVGTLIESVEVTELMELGKTFIPPVGIEAAFDNFTMVQSEEFYKQFPQLDVKDEKLVALDKVREVKLGKENEVIVLIDRSIFKVNYEANNQMIVSDELNDNQAFKG